MVNPMKTMFDLLSTIPTFGDVEDAAKRIVPHIRRTPVLESEALNALIKGRLLIKAEPLQRTGSFKIRGAINAISRLSEDAKTGGVVAYSSGNHAQAVAAAAQEFGMPAVIVMPNDSPQIKIDGVKRRGGEVVLYDRWRESREALAEAIKDERGATLIPPFDHPHIIAGQGTLALEMMRQVADMGAKLDAVLMGASGGGMAAGISLVTKTLSPDTKVYSVEPAGFDDLAQSLAKGTRVAHNNQQPSICDALMATIPGVIPFEILKSRTTAGFGVTDEEVMTAMRLAFLHLKLVIEPGGAAALAAVLAGKLDTEGKTLAVVASGGNVDPVHYAQILARA